MNTIMEINWIGEAADTIFSLMGKGGRWLNIKRNRSCFLVWSVCVIWWAIRDFYVGFYSQGIFCLVSLCFHVYGWIEWGKERKKE